MLQHTQLEIVLLYYLSIIYYSQLLLLVGIFGANSVNISVYLGCINELIYSVFTI